MPRQRDPQTGTLMMEGVRATVSERTEKVSFRARYTYGVGAHRRFVSRTFKGYAAAEAWMLDQRMSLSTGRHIDPVTLTVDQYYEQWSKRMARTWSGARQRTVRNTWKNHFLPYFSGVRMQSVTRPMIQQLVDRLADRALKGTTIRMYMASVASLFTAAQHDGLIARSPVWGITWPRHDHTPRPIWSPLQLRRFLQGAKAANDPLYPLWAFLVATGCRIGEALAIQWRDIDLGSGADAGSAWIHRTVTRGDTGTATIREGTKTSDTGRTVPLDPWIVGILRGLDREQPDHPVFQGRHGGELKYPTVLPKWRAAAAMSGLPVIRPHDIRHSVASMMVASGVSERIVQEILGHKSITITLNTYAHTDLRQQRQGTNKVSELIGMIEHDNTGQKASSE